MRKAIFTIVVGLCLSLSSIGKESQVQSSVSSVTYDELQSEERKQVDCLALNIHIEAGGESEKGKIAVGLVTMNRVKSDLFPKTVCGVVKQKTGNKCQFSWVCDKHAKKIDTKSKDYIRNLATNIFVKHNIIHDFTNGSLFFVNKSSKIISKNMIKTVMIGNHVFYKFVN